MTRLAEAHPGFGTQRAPSEPRLLSEVTWVCYTVLINSAYPL